MTITELIQSGLSWPELRDKLIAWPYKTPARNEVNPQTAAEAITAADNATFHDPGTWDEVRRARNFGMITNDQYLEVARALGATTAAGQALELGDVEGHDFHGNQWTGSTARDVAAAKRLRAAHVAVRVDKGVVSRVLGGGYLKNAFKLSAAERARRGLHSGYMGNRERAEARMFGPGKHPIYGYATTNPNINIGFGDYALVLRPEMRAVTTVTGSDSLVGEVDPVPHPIDQVEGASKVLREVARDSGAGDPLATEYGFVEAQIMGAIGPRQVAAIHGPSFTDSQRAKAEKYGIKLVESGSFSAGQTLEFVGDVAGHEFHGNQWTGGMGHLTDEERKMLVGGLKPSDFPYGRYPTQIQHYADYMYQKDPWSDEVKRSMTPGWGGKPATPSIPRLQLEWSPEEQAAARQALADKLQNGTPAVRMPMAAFKEMLQDGTIRNQWETGSTGAATGKKDSYEPARSNAETTSLGVPEDAKPEERPVYGYVAPGDSKGDFLRSTDAEDVQAAINHLPARDETLVEIAKNPDDYYLGIAPSSHNGGEGAFVSIWSADQLATRMDGDEDSKYYRDTAREPFYPLGDGHGNWNADTVLGYANSQYAANQYGDVQIDLKRDVLDTATVTGGDSIDGHLMGVPARMAEAGDERIPIGMTMLTQGFRDGTRAEYAELQFHQHPTLDDIEAVHFTNAKPTKTIQQELESAGIKWDYEKMPRLSRANTIPMTDILAKGKSSRQPGESIEQAMKRYHT